MSKVADVRVLDVAHSMSEGDVPETLQVALADIAATAREGLLALAVSVGLAVMSEVMEAEITAKVGAKHARLADRTARRYAATDSSVVLGGRKVAVRRPRARTLDGQEVQLESFAAFADGDQLDRLGVSNGCWRGWRRAGTVRPTSPSARPWRRPRRRRRSRRCRGHSCAPPRVSWMGCSAGTCRSCRSQR